MCKKAIIVVFLLSLFAIPTTVFGNGLVAHWKFDDNANDSSGNGNTGTLYNMDESDWVAGMLGTALDFDGTDDYVNIVSSSFDLETHTTSFWIKPGTLGYKIAIELVKGTTRAFGYIGLSGEGQVRHYVRSGIISNTTRIDAMTDSIVEVDNWYHIISIMGSQGNKIYVNGVEQTLSYTYGSASSTESWAVIDNGRGPNNLNISCLVYDGVGHDFFDGIIDDVKIFNSFNPPVAHDPSPVDEDSTDAASVVLSWSPGSDAYSHDVYFGTDETAVSSAQRDIGDIDGNGVVDWFDMDVLRGQWLSSPQEPFADLDGDGNVNLLDYAIFAADWRKQGPLEYKGNQTNLSYTTGFLPGGVRYYWRIDEVNGTDIWKGNVWSFDTSRDLYSDTWVAVDDLGRALPDSSQCGPPRSDRYVALFYSIWLGEHGTGGPYDVTKLLAANPTNPAWGPAGDFHHWGESELGYYLSDDEYVMRKHAHMIADADVDLIVFDVTNGWTYRSTYMTFFSVFTDIRAEGGTTPQIAFMANAYADIVVTNIYNALYSQNLYPDLWFYWKGKPLMLAPLNGMEILGRTITYSQEIQDFFNFRYTWTWMSAGYDIWKWLDYYPQQYGWHESPSIPEQISVSAAIVPHQNQGRSYQNNTQPAHDEYGLSGTEEQGLCFAEQWSRLDQIDPEFLFITGWNGWVSQRQVFTGSGDPVTHFIGDPLEPGDSWFLDLYNQEYSNDIEPMKDGHTDNYYYQMIDGIRKYKGVRQRQIPSAAKTITIDGNFSDWQDVGPEYRDWKADTTHRNHPGWGSAGTYINTTGRNDLLTSKVARDNTYIYFYIETTENITGYTDPNWMLLFINADQNYADGWKGYDYVVNMQVNSATSTTLKGTSGGWNWTNVDSNVLYQVSGNKMEIRIARSDISQGSGSDPVAFDFHWADNIQNTDDIIEFAVSGDSAPGRRFNYRYDNEVVVPGVFNTGVDASGNALADRVQDPHWTLTSSADPTYNGPETYTVKSDEFPIPPWVANTSNSKWICPRQNSTSVEDGTYVYQLQFDLTGYDPDSAQMTGQYSADNSLTNVKINGVSTGINGGGFDSWHAFGISSGFATGTNTLEFFVNNAGISANPSGLRVELTVTAVLQD